MAKQLSRTRPGKPTATSATKAERKRITEERIVPSEMEIAPSEAISGIRMDSISDCTYSKSTAGAMLIKGTECIFDQILFMGNREKTRTI